MVYTKSMVALAELLPGMGRWHKGSPFCPYACYPLSLKPNYRDVQNILFWTYFILYKLIRRLLNISEITGYSWYSGTQLRDILARSLVPGTAHFKASIQSEWPGFVEGFGEDRITNLK